MQKEILNIGIEFFILQLCGVVIFSSGNILISRLFGNAEVTNYSLINTY